MNKIFIKVLSATVWTILSTAAYAQSPAEREAQRLTPRTPGAWPSGSQEVHRPIGDVPVRPRTAIYSEIINPTASAYCDYNDLRIKPAGNYLEYISTHQTCIGKDVYENKPLGFDSFRFSELCNDLAFAIEPKNITGHALTKIHSACTLAEFSDSVVSTEFWVGHDHDIIDGNCYKTPTNLCSFSSDLVVRVRCVVAMRDPAPVWDCSFDGVTPKSFRNSRTQSFPYFDDPVPTTSANQQAILDVVKSHVKTHLAN